MRLNLPRYTKKCQHHSSVNGVYPACKNEEWTCGFWPGEIWLAYERTRDGAFRQAGLALVDSFERRIRRKVKVAHHDMGFLYTPSCVAAYKLTGEEKARQAAILAADQLVSRFQPRGEFIQAWGRMGSPINYRFIIDCLLNLPLLYWAYEQIHDPRFLQIATMHADTAQKYFIREDGSANHIVSFDPVTGEFLETFGGQGYAEGSSWTRGQAWALYGFVLSYVHTKKDSYLNTARRVANYFIANTPESGLIPVDFRQPADCTLEDSTAAAIAACGLLEIAGQLEQTGELGKTESRVYKKAALKLLTALEEKRCNWDENHDNLLEKCTAAFHDEAHEFSIIYGDYYFIEAVWKLTGEELFIW